jgi:hypothetical protein
VTADVGGSWRDVVLAANRKRLGQMVRSRLESPHAVGPPLGVSEAPEDVFVVIGEDDEQFRCRLEVALWWQLAKTRGPLTEGPAGDERAVLVRRMFRLTHLLCLTGVAGCVRAWIDENLEHCPPSLPKRLDALNEALGALATTLPPGSNHNSRFWLRLVRDDQEHVALRAFAGLLRQDPKAAADELPGLLGKFGGGAMTAAAEMWARSDSRRAVIERIQLGWRLREEWASEAMRALEARLQPPAWKALCDELLAGVVVAALAGGAEGTGEARVSEAPPAAPRTTFTDVRQALLALVDHRPAEQRVARADKARFALVSSQLERKLQGQFDVAAEELPTEALEAFVADPFVLGSGALVLREGRVRIDAAAFSRAVATGWGRLTPEMKKVAEDVRLTSAKRGRGRL